MKKIILILVSTLLPSLALAKIKLVNKSDAWVFVTSEWDINNKAERLLAPNSAQMIREDGALIKRKFTVQFVADPEVIPPYDFTDLESAKAALSPVMDIDREGKQIPNMQKTAERMQDVIARLNTWRNQLQTAAVMVPENGTLDQIVTIIGAVDPKTERFNLKAVNKLAQDADKE